MRWSARLSKEYALAYRDGLRSSILGRYTDASEQAPVVKAMRLDRRSLLLDAGCGTGRFLANVHPDQPFVGLDLSVEMLNVARGS